jgi:1-acyl-sn-glycerol-3-phosphate acyltransferase
MTYFLFTIAILGLLLAYGLCVPFYLLGRVWKPATNWGDTVMQKGIWFLMAIQPWLRSAIELPADMRGKLLISNHRSHLDVFLFLANVRGVRVLAKDMLFRVPGLGFIMRMSHQIPVARGDMDSYLRSLETVKGYLRNQETVLIFPEMTRGLSGLQEFRLAPFKIAREIGADILPVVIRGSEAVWPRNKMKLSPGSVEMRSLEPISARGFAKSEDLCRTVHATMLRELV